MAGDAVLLQDVAFVAVAMRASMINPIGKGAVTFLPCSNPLPGLTASNRCKIKSMRALRSSQRDSVRVFRRGCGAPFHVLGRPCWQSDRDMDCFCLDIRRNFRNKKFECYASDVGKDEELDPEDDKTDIEGALNIDEEIPSTSDSFLKQVSSRTYDMRRKLEQNLDSSSYDVLDTNPWRDDSKSLYVLAQEDERLLTMRTRRARSEVERELGLLFPKRGSRRGPNGSPRNKSSEQLAPGKPNQDSRFCMQVEDVREGVLVKY
ncbi:hypothetical protein O6H91_Y317100 [Diphasiastrum complanatum]|nr:hypothetical protein O6H91_Y317100 [Diphasiastrum complanatum]